MNVKELRAEHPDWNWTSERMGFSSYRYHGVRGDERVTVYATACLCGPYDDDFATIWRADNGKVSETYAFWSMKHI